MQISDGKKSLTALCAERIALATKAHFTAEEPLVIIGSGDKTLKWSKYETCLFKILSDFLKAADEVG